MEVSYFRTLQAYHMIHKFFVFKTRLLLFLPMWIMALNRNLRKVMPKHMRNISNHHLYMKAEVCNFPCGFNIKQTVVSFPGKSWSTFSCGQKDEKRQEREIVKEIRQEYKDLGPMSFAEVVVLIHFLVLVVLWLTRNPGFVMGWSILFPPGYITDAVPSILVSLSLFAFPSQRPRLAAGQGFKSGPAILVWNEVSKSLPWGVLLLMGGGFAVADACKVSGLSAMVAKYLLFVGQFPTWLAGLILVSLASLATEITSNTVIATLFLPIEAEMASSMGVNPLYFMLPTAIAASFAFMFPVGTPPNAIVFAYGDIKVSDMVKAGLGLKVLTLAVLMLAMNTYCYTYFNLQEFPIWAAPSQPTPPFVLNTTELLINVTHITLTVKRTS